MRTFPVRGVGALLCYHDLPGDEPTIVFLHGLGAASSEELCKPSGTRCLQGSECFWSISSGLASRSDRLNTDTQSRITLKASRDSFMISTSGAPTSSDTAWVGRLRSHWRCVTRTWS